MSLEHINYISQIISTLAVVASLIFVGLQLRQSAKATRLSAYEAAQGRLDNVRQAIMSDPDLAETFSKGLADPMLLDDRQLVRFRLVLFVAANALETLHTMFVQSHIGASEWNKVKPTALRIFTTPGGRAWLALFKDEIDPKLAKVLNELVESKPISGMPSRADWQAAMANKTQS
jgi:hypothetical protein